jgi:hypothetical protein
MMTTTPRNILVIGVSSSIKQLFGIDQVDRTARVTSNGFQFQFLEIAGYGDPKSLEVLANMTNANEFDAIIVAVYGDDDRVLILDDNGRYVELIALAEELMERSGRGA